MPKVKIAVVGLGFVGGSAHVPSFKNVEVSELVAVCDTDENKAKELAGKYDTDYYLDYEKLLELDELDAVVLAVPTPFHYDFSLKALKAGKNVLCEMPITPTVEQAKELGEVAEENGRILMPVLNFRFAPIYNKIKEMIRQDKIGSPIALHFREFIPIDALAEQWPAGSWSWDIEKSGGYPDFTLSVWSLAMIPWMFDSKIKKVSWESNYTEFEEYGGIKGYNTVGAIKLENGIAGSIHYGSAVKDSASGSRLEIYGDNSNVLHAIENDEIALFGADSEKQEWELDVSGPRVWGHQQIDEHFTRTVLGGEEIKAPVEDAVDAIRIAKKIVR